MPRQPALLRYRVSRYCVLDTEVLSTEVSLPKCRESEGVPQILVLFPLPGQEGGQGDGRKGAIAPWMDRDE